MVKVVGDEENPKEEMSGEQRRLTSSCYRDFSFTLFHATVQPVIDDLFHVLIARMHKLGILLPDTKESD